MIEVATESRRTCASCKHTKAMVVDSRFVASSGLIRRRLECTACKSRWTTYEMTSDRFDDMERVCRKIATLRRSIARLGRDLNRVSPEKKP